MNAFKLQKENNMPNLVTGKIVAMCFIALTALVTGCKDSREPAPEAAVALPSGTISTETPSTVVGTIPAGPTADVAGTTSAAKSDVSKSQQSSAMPLPGQANDHSTLSPAASQKADTVKK
jgi:hypothetical protein